MSTPPAAGREAHPTANRDSPGAASQDTPAAGQHPVPTTGLDTRPAAAGLGVLRHWADGVVELSIPIPRQAALGQGSPYLDAVARRERRADVASLGHLLSPASVAVVGASRLSASAGRTILRNIRDAGYAGRLYAVNPNADEIDGVSCARSVTALPEPVDLAVIAVPPPAVAAAVQECGERGVKALVVITAGLGSADKAGILATCRRHEQRHAVLVGAGRGDPASGAVRGVVR